MTMDQGMRRRRLTTVIVTLIVALAVGCSRDGTSPSRHDAAIATDASASHDAGLSPCTLRASGPIEALERAAECAVKCADVADPLTIRTSLESVGGRVLPGGPGAVLARITNVGSAPVTLCLRAESSAAGGWEKVSGITAPAADTKCERPHFSFPLRTFGRRDASVDELDVNANVICSRTVRAVLLPGRSLTKTLQWAAIRLPAAPRPWEDDAGHRYYAKAIPVPLRNGTYRIEAELPFVDAPGELRKVSALVDVMAE